MTSSQRLNLPATLTLCLLFSFGINAQKELRHKSFSDTVFVVNDVILAPQINFILYECDFMPESTDSVNTITAFLSRYPALSVEIGVHDENRGSARANMRLTSCRAQKIIKHLTTQGISPRRLKAKGYGATQPLATRREIMSKHDPHVATNKHASNKRVELRIIGIN